MYDLHSSHASLASLGALAAAVALLPVAVGCDAIPGEPSGLDRDVLEVTATGHTSFELGATEVPSGWVTLRFHNQTDAVHFVVVEKMPSVDGDQKTVEDSREEVVPVFQNIMDDINGESPSFPDAGFELPSWYSQVVFVGGPGLTSPNETSRATMNLEPGTYVVECYVKTEDGTFHSTEDMIAGLTVTGSSGGAPAPAADATVTVSSQAGIETTGTLGTGTRTVEVTFADQTVYGHFLGHDVHLVRVEQGADTEALAAWMNWAAPGGLAEPAPGGARFLGGVQDMPGGSTAYMTVDLTAGDYAWIAEVPDPVGKDMMVPFTVE